MDSEKLRLEELPPTQTWVNVCPFDPLESRLKNFPLGPGELYKFDILCGDHFDMEPSNPNIGYDDVLGDSGEILFKKMRPKTVPQHGAPENS